MCSNNMLYLAEYLSGKTPEKITEVLEHKPGVLCTLINAVLSIDDDSKVSLV